MTERSYFWGGTTVGDATLAPYDDDEFSDIFRKMFSTDRTVEGILRSYLNELEVTNPAGVTVRVKTGAALVDGKFYENTANVDNSVVAPGAGSNYYRVVLQKGWVAQTVRIAVLGPDAGSPPAVTQSDGVTWEISLATVEITSGSVVTVTDTREYVHYAQTVQEDNIEDSAVTVLKLDSTLRHVLLKNSTIAADGDTIDWTGIPGDYSQLKLVVAARATATGGGLVDAGLRINFNGIVTNTYRSVEHSFAFNEDESDHADSGTIGYLKLNRGVNPDSDAANRFGAIEMTIRNYSNTTMIKQALWHSAIYGDAIFEHAIGHGFWTGLNAITRIQITSDENVGSGNYGFATASEFRLYGIP